LNILTGELVAVKSYKIKGEKNAILRELIDDVKKLQKLNNKHIAKYLGIQLNE